MDAGARRDSATHSGQRFLRLLRDTVPLNQTASAGKSETEGEVLRDCHPLDQAEILVDECDRRFPTKVAHRPASEKNLAGGRSVYTCQDFYQRGLTGAVTAKQSKNLMTKEVQCNIVNSEGASELFHDTLEPQQRLITPALGVIRSFSTGNKIHLGEVN
jgi:hypothetical protein